MLHSFGAVVAGVITAVTLRARARLRSDAEAIENAVPLLDGFELADAWVRVTGPVVCPSSPLSSINRTPCAVIRDELRANEIRASGGNVERSSRVLNRSWTEAAAWGVERDADARASVALVEPDAVRRAFERSPNTVSGLVSVGMELVPRNTPWFATVFKALAGVLDEETVRRHDAIPVGHIFSIAALASLRDGKLTLSTHPTRGFFVSRDLDATALELRTLEFAWTAGAVCAAACTGYFIRGAWLAYRERHSNEAADDASARGRQWDGQSGLQQSASILQSLDVPAASRDQECVACATSKRAVVFTPCGHLCLCFACTRTLIGGPTTARRCPMCREPIVDVVRVFQ